MGLFKKKEAVKKVPVVAPKMPELPKYNYPNQSKNTIKPMLIKLIRLNDSTVHNHKHPENKLQITTNEQAYK